MDNENDSVRQTAEFFRQNLREALSRSDVVIVLHGRFDREVTGRAGMDLTQDVAGVRGVFSLLPDRQKDETIAAMLQGALIAVMEECGSHAADAAMKVMQDHLFSKVKSGGPVPPVVVESGEVQ